MVFVCYVIYVEVSGKKGEIPLSCSELLTNKKIGFRLLKYIFVIQFSFIVLYR